MIKVADASGIQRVTLPQLVREAKGGNVFSQQRVFDRHDVDVVEAKIFERSSGNVVRLLLSTPDFTLEVVAGRLGSGVEGGGYSIEAPDAKVVDGTLDCGENARWGRHPSLLLRGDSSERARTSWANAVSLQSAAPSSEPRLRHPQLGGLHALAAHWTVMSSPAQIILPTGTGKTDMMLAAIVMHSPRRTLILVPSDSLREQTFSKFVNFGVLRQVAFVTEEALSPVVGRLTKSPAAGEPSAASVGMCNIVISTVAMLDKSTDVELKAFLGNFDVIFFDEAHHLAAPSWGRMSQLAAAKLVLLTATPFRNDGRRIPGEVIYQFPLRLAQEQGYFRKIGFVEVDEPLESLADEKIALAAVNQLRADECAGFRHLIMARARSKAHAEKLYDEIYLAQYPHLNPVVLHSGTRKRADVVSALRAGVHRVVICVDMLGEGFDLPSLKIAAMHEIHKSLPITLQFIGRFTRGAADVGEATVIANTAGPKVYETIADLYAEDADWNDLVPGLSARAIQSERDLSQFISTMKEVPGTSGQRFDLATLRPKTSALIYKVNSFKPQLFLARLGKNAFIHQVWQRKGLLIAIVNEKPKVAWSYTTDVVDDVWSLYIVAHDVSRKVIYLHASGSNKGLGRLASDASGGTAKLVCGEEMYRAFHGLSRTILQNVGLYRQGKLRFQMLAGIDVGDHVSSAVQAGSIKSNLFAIGFDGGLKTSVGASFKGRVWSMSSSSLPDWISWCEKMCARILDSKIPAGAFLEYTLIPVEIKRLPVGDVFTAFLPETLIGDRGDAVAFTVGMDQQVYDLLEISITKVDRDKDKVSLVLSIGGEIEVVFTLAWAGIFSVSQPVGERVKVRIGSDSHWLDEYFLDNAPALLMTDGSEVHGNYHFRSLKQHPFTFSPKSVRPIDWGSTPITAESKWKNGLRRSSSVQGFMIEELKKDPNLIVMDDDDSGEAADIVTIKEDVHLREVLFTFYHCKFSGGIAAGKRYGDLYEVCGQAVKSTRLVHRPDQVLSHLLKREKRLGGRQTRFEQGTERQLKSLATKLPHYRSRFQIAIVQPGLSVAQLDGNLASILGSADSYVRDFTGMGLEVYGSA